MDCIFNKEKIERVLSDFYSSTGIAVTLYDASERIVATSPVYSGCCSYIRTKQMCVENCDRSNLEHMKEMSLNRKTIRYTCHAGLMETILPIEYEDILIAYMQIGQFRDAEGVYSAPDKLKETAARYGFSKEKLLSLYGDIPVVSEEKLSALCRIVEILIKSFWEDGLIAYHRSMLSVRIEKYICEHLSDRLCVDDICSHFFLSKNALYHLFREEFNTTANEFITQKRLQHAQELLLSDRTCNVTQIASACGFPDYNYFIRLFKQQTGVTPLQFRKKQQSLVLNCNNKS